MQHAYLPTSARSQRDKYDVKERRIESAILFCSRLVAA